VGIKTEINHLSNRDLLVPYALPYLAYVGIASITRGILPAEISYVLKIIVVPSLLYWAWKWYCPLTGPKKIAGSVAAGICFGIAGTAAWCILMKPFAPPDAAVWTKPEFLLRLFSASLIVPVFEEIFIRGFVLRAAFQWDMNRKNGVKSPLKHMLDYDCINDVRPGAWTVLAVAVSTIAFAAGHVQAQWPAAVVFSVLMAVLWIVRKDLLSCIIAHGITNFTLALYVYFTGQWGLW
jgi:membrane protease YdiL (CAAX protease family)